MPLFPCVLSLALVVCLPICTADVMYIGPWQEFKLAKLLSEHAKIAKTTAQVSPVL